MYISSRRTVVVVAVVAVVVSHCVICLSQHLVCLGNCSEVGLSAMTPDMMFFTLLAPCLIDVNPNDWCWEAALQARTASRREGRVQHTVDTRVVRFHMGLLNFSIFDDQDVAFASNAAQEGGGVKGQVESGSECRSRVGEEADLGRRQ